MFGTNSSDCIIFRHSEILNFLKCILILVELSFHKYLNQKYPSVLKYYGKTQFVENFYIKRSEKGLILSSWSALFTQSTAHFRNYQFSLNTRSIQTMAQIMTPSEELNSAIIVFDVLSASENLSLTNKRKHCIVNW